MRTSLAFGFALLVPLVPVLRAQEGVSTFGDARTRHLAALGRLPAPADVIVEDFVNYHRHALPLPRAGDALALDLRWGGSSSGEDGTAVLQIGLATPHLHDRRELPRLSLALVVDRSGSMSAEGKLDQVKRALERFITNLRPSDAVALVAYSDEAVLLRPCRPIGDGEDLRALIRSLEPTQSTNLHAGLMLGLRELAAIESAGSSRRAILLTDGIANRGVTEPAAIASEAASYLERGIDVSTIGVGTELQRDLLVTLAQRGRGLAHFVGDAQDVSKVFDEEFQSLVAPAAREVEVELELPRRAHLEQIFGYAPERTERGVRLALPDLSFGATLVILARITCPGSASELDAVQARVRFLDVAKRTNTVLATEALLPPAKGEPLADAAVRKNFAIARLAHGLKQMASEASAEQWAAAERRLEEPLRFVERLFPSGDDEDLKRVLDVARRCRQIVRQKLEGDGI